MKIFRLVLAGAAIAALVAFAGVGRPDRASGDTAPGQAAHSITVSGNGAVSATPNQAVFTFGVSTQGKTAVTALAANSTAMQKVIDALEGAGIPSDFLRTASVSLSPVTSDQGDAIVGYTASNSVTVTIASIAKAGAIVDVAVKAGANQVDGPNLTVSDQSALYDRALKAAIADARAKAQVLADASGLHVGAVSSVEEEGGTTPVTFDSAKALPATGPPIEAGTQQVTASVTVTFEASS
jgi:uncharacterized protein YggE